MRRGLSYLFLLIFLGYHLGFVGLYWIGSRSIDSYWKSSVEFSGPQKEISIPLALPYWQDQDEFQIADGSINFEGINYRIVKQRYARDTIHFIVVHDALTDKLHQSVDDWVQNSAANNQTEKSTNTLFSFIVKDYWAHKRFEFNALNIDIPSEFFSPGLSVYSSLKLDIESPPPQLV